MARATKKTRRRLDLHEDIVRGKAHKVDRDKGIIYGVKILGLESLNDRRYTPEALQKAKPLYEGIGVYVNHPAKPNDPRPVRERFGRLVNVRMETDGLYGDLEYLKAHPEAALIAEAAERMPEQFGLSHNAKGEGIEEDGLFVIQEIVSLRSVDVVTEPATTGGMFEQRQTVKITIKQLFENSWKKYAKKTTKRPRLAAYMKRLVEDDAYDAMDDEAEGVEEVPADHEEALKGGFEASVAAIVRDCLDGEEDPKESIKKIGELLKAHHKLAGGDDAAEDDMEEEEEPDKKDEPDKKETEEQKQLKILKRKDRARELCEENELPLAGKSGKVLLKALCRCDTDAEMKELIEHEKSKGDGKGNNGGGNRNAPRSGATGGDSKTQTTLEGVDTPEGVLAALLG